MSAIPASLISPAISLAYLRISPNSGGIVPRMPTTPARQWSGSSQSENFLWCTAAEPKSQT
jgi:hypothetical protein